MYRNDPVFLNRIVSDEWTHYCGPDDKVAGRILLIYSQAINVDFEPEMFSDFAQSMAVEKPKGSVSFFRCLGFFKNRVIK